MLGATLAKGPGRCCPPLRVVLGVTAARLLLLPLLGTGWLLLASKAGARRRVERHDILTAAAGIAQLKLHGKERMYA